MNTDNFPIIPNRGPYNVGGSSRILMLVLSWMFCYIVTGVIQFILFKSGITLPKLRIMMVVQDVVVFILPAILTAIVVARQPADFLMLRKRVPIAGIIRTLLTLIVSIPVMELLIQWNGSLSLPESMSGVETWMRQSEEAANSLMSQLMGEPSVGGLIMTLLIIGVMAGVSEELFFRGAMQRVFASTGLKSHLAVWLTAVIFSAVHLQFFGFFPRLMLGAFFGYLALWSGSIWLPVIAHIFNNSVAAIGIWDTIKDNPGMVVPDAFSGTVQFDIPVIVVSIIATLLGLYSIYQTFHKADTAQNNSGCAS